MEAIEPVKEFSSETKADEMNWMGVNQRVTAAAWHFANEGLVLIHFALTFIWLADCWEIRRTEIIEDSLYSHHMGLNKKREHTFTRLLVAQGIHECVFIVLFEKWIPDTH